MSNFPVHTAETAPEAAASLERAHAKFGLVPNLMGVFAGSPAAAGAYLDIAERFEASSLNPVEQQVVAISTAFENGCEYCMAAHSTIATMVSAPDEILAALRAGTDLPDAKLNALATLTRQMVRERGWVSEGDIAAFTSAGYTTPQVLDVILGVTLKTLSNYTNHIAQPPVDAPFAPQAWTRPAVAA